GLVLRRGEGVLGGLKAGLGGRDRGPRRLHAGRGRRRRRGRAGGRVGGGLLGVGERDPGGLELLRGRAGEQLVVGGLLLAERRGGLVERGLLIGRVELGDDVALLDRLADRDVEADQLAG